MIVMRVKLNDLLIKRPILELTSGAGLITDHYRTLVIVKTMRCILSFNIHVYKTQSSVKTLCFSFSAEFSKHHGGSSKLNGSIRFEQKLSKLRLQSDGVSFTCMYLQNNPTFTKHRKMVVSIK